MKLRSLIAVSVVGAALAVPSLASANASADLVCQDGKNVIATVGWSNYPVQDKTFRINIVTNGWFSFHQSDVSFTEASGKFVHAQEAVPGTHEYVLYATRLWGGVSPAPNQLTEVARQTLTCNEPLPVVTPTPEPEKPVVTPNPKPKKPVVTTQRKVFVVKTVGCVPGTRPYRVERIRVRWVRDGKVFRTKWSKPYTKYGAVCPLPPVAG
jgi:hypothetical protein